MAEENSGAGSRRLRTQGDPSGSGSRQGVAGSGVRAAVTGSGVRPGVTGSGARPGVTGSGVRPAVASVTGSGVRQGVSGSGRQSAVGTTTNARQAAVGKTSARNANMRTATNRAAVRAEGFSSRRAAPGVSARKQQPFPVKAVLIAAGAMVLIGGICAALYFVKHGTYKEFEDHKRAQDKLFEDNIQAGRDEIAKAEKVGTLYVMGQENIPATDKVKLFAPFQGNSKIYNVIYDRTFSDKRKNEQHDARILSDDSEKQKIKSLNKGVEEGKLSINYALVDNGKTPVVIAKKNVSGKKDDPVNVGGQIVVVVFAQKDDFFEKALKKEAEGPTPEKATAPAATPASAPAATK